MEGKPSVLGTSYSGSVPLDRKEGGELGGQGAVIMSRASVVTTTSTPPPSLLIASPGPPRISCPPSNRLFPFLHEVEPDSVFLYPSSFGLAWDSDDNHT